MDDQVQKQLLKQLKLLNFWISFFGVLFLIGLGIVGFLLWQVILFTQNAGEQLQTLQKGTEQLNMSSQLCSDKSLGEFLRQNSSVCE